MRLERIQTPNGAVYGIPQNADGKRSAQGFVGATDDATQQREKKPTYSSAPKKRVSEHNEGVEEVTVTQSATAHLGSLDITA